MTSSCSISSSYFPCCKIRKSRPMVAPTPLPSKPMVCLGAWLVTSFSKARASSPKFLRCVLAIRWHPWGQVQASLTWLTCNLPLNKFLQETWSNPATQRQCPKSPRIRALACCNCSCNSNSRATSLFLHLAQLYRKKVAWTWLLLGRWPVFNRQQAHNSSRIRTSCLTNCSNKLKPPII